jgi:hypothetical protein
VTTMTMWLSPAEAEALVWAAAAATGPVSFPEELLASLARAEAHLLVGLARATAAGPPGGPQEPSGLRRCVRCGRPWPACRCRHAASSSPDAPPRPGPEVGHDGFSRSPEP